LSEVVAQQIERLVERVGELEEIEIAR